MRMRTAWRSAWTGPTGTRFTGWNWPTPARTNTANSTSRSIRFWPRAGWASRIACASSSRCTATTIRRTTAGSSTTSSSTPARAICASRRRSGRPRSPAARPRSRWSASTATPARCGWITPRSPGRRRKAAITRPRPEPWCSPTASGPKPSSCRCFRISTTNRRKRSRCRFSTRLAAPLCSARRRRWWRSRTTMVRASSPSRRCNTRSRRTTARPPSPCGGGLATTGRCRFAIAPGRARRRRARTTKRSRARWCFPTDRSRNISRCRCWTTRTSKGWRRSRSFWRSRRARNSSRRPTPG